MAYFTSQELASIKNDAKPKAATKPKGRGGFLTSLISEAGGFAGGVLGAPLGPAGIAAGAAAGSGLGRLIENKVRDDEFKVGDAAKEAAFSGITAGGPVKLLKGAKNLVKGTKAAETVAEPAGKSFMNDLTSKTGRRLTEVGSGLKADTNVGGVARLEDNANFMSKYTGTPRTQRVKMETDMRGLSKQVDDTLAKTPIQLDGAQVGQRLKAAATDLTDERYLDLDLNNPSVTKIIDRYSQKFAATQDAKGVNDIVKTLNKTATRAQNKLLDEKGGVLTAQEQAALALKRAGDDVLSQIPEIAPLKKNMAQIFEVTPQVAKAGEKGIGVPFMTGLTVKTPIQTAKGVASHAGAALQGASDVGVPGKLGLAGRIATGSTLANSGEAQPDEEQTVDPVDAEGQQAQAVTADDVLAAESGTGGQDTDPYSPTNVQATVRNILSQGGTQKDVQEFLSNAKMVNDLSASSTGKPLSAEAAKVTSNAETGLTAISDFEKLVQDDPAAFSRSNIPGKGFLDNLTGGRVSGALGTSEIDAASDQIVDVIARLRTGAAISKQEEDRFKRYIPRSGDTPEAMQQKLGYLRNQFQMVAQRTGGSGSDLQAAIAQ
jgi:hypothetical protein